MAEIPLLKLDPELATQLPQVRYATAPGEALESSARFLSGVSQAIERRLDVQAEIDAGKEGGIAGLQADFKPTGEGSIRGRSYDAAGIRSYLGQLEVRARGDAEKIYQEFGHDPKILAGKLDDLTRGYMSGTFAEAQPAVAEVLARDKTAYLAASGRQALAAEMDTRRAALTEQLAARATAIDRLSAMAGTDAQASEVISRELAETEELLLSFGPRQAFEWRGKRYEASETRGGVFSLEDVAKTLVDFRSRAAEGRILGRFDQLGSAGAKQNFLDGIEEDFRNPKEGDALSALTANDVRRIGGYMRGEIGRLKAEGRAAVAGLKDEAREAIRIIGEGYNPGSDKLRAMYTQARALGDEQLASDLAAAEHLRVRGDEFRKATPVELQNYVNERSGELANKDGVTRIEAAELELAGKVLTTMSTEVRRDPLSWVSRVGLMRVAPIELAGDNAIASMKARAAQGEAAASIYGVAPRYLTDEEATALKSALTAAPPTDRLALITSINDGFGPDKGKRVWAQLDNDDPVNAHIGGLTGLGAGHLKTATDAVVGQDIVKQAGTDILPPAKERAAIVSQVIGAAIAPEARAREAIEKTASAIYASRAQAKGLTAADYDDELYARSLQEAAGAVYSIDGERISGGFGSVNGFETALPPGVHEDAIETFMRRLSDEDLKTYSLGGAPLDARGKAVSAEIVRDGRFVAIGGGDYLVELDGQILDGGDGQPFALRLQPLLEVLQHRESKPLPAASAIGGALLDGGVVLTP